MPEFSEYQPKPSLDDKVDNSSSKQMVQKSNEKIEALMPKENHSCENIAEASRKNLDTILDLFPKISQEQVTLQDLEQLEPGTYSLARRPSIDILQQLPGFKNGTSEVGVLCVNKRWLVEVGKKGETATNWHYTLRSIQHERLFQADIHSHPGSDPGAYQPSEGDIGMVDSTFDGRNYIISNKGLLEYRLPDELPGGIKEHNPVRFAWNHWILNDLKLSEDKFNKRGGWELKKEFYERFYGLRTIPWENREEIENILASKENLTPKFEESPSSFPAGNQTTTP